MNDREDKPTEELTTQTEYYPYELLTFSVIICSALLEICWLWGKL